MSPIHDLIIIGAGPAGYTAALYAGRANMEVLLFEGWQPGGQLTTTTVIENYPGFHQGIDGTALMKEMRDQAAVFGSKYIAKDVTRVDFYARPFKVYVGDEEFQSKVVIISTGAKPRKLGLPSEETFWAKGVSSCATCDGFFFRGKKVAVIGGGDSAMEEATFLTKFASEVVVIHRRDKLRASKMLQNRAFNNPKIQFIWNSAVREA